MTCPPYLPIVTTPVRYDAIVFVHEAYNYLTQTGHDHCAHYNYINRTCHSATLGISEISDTSEFYSVLRRSCTRFHLYSFTQWFQQSGTSTPERTQQNRRGNVEVSSSYDLRPNFL